MMPCLPISPTQEDLGWKETGKILSNNYSLAFLEVKCGEEIFTGFTSYSSQDGESGILVFTGRDICNMSG